MANCSDLILCVVSGAICGERQPVVYGEMGVLALFSFPGINQENGSVRCIKTKRMAGDGEAQDVRLVADNNQV